jgi:hypothetical protein
MATEPTPEFKAALTKGLIVDSILLAAGGVASFVTGEIWWIVVATVVGGSAFVLFLAQAGAFKKADER